MEVVKLFKYTWNRIGHNIRHLTSYIAVRFGDYSDDYRS